MATSEIEKLERRYAENPHGLTFAPLAEVHRKNGDIPRALELLRIGLELHPNYIPASIVLGRCHQDLGDLPAAEEAFSHVLRLDDENVIALKSLADINERQDKLEDAERWLRRLVSVDRSNEEAREQLEHIETLKQQSRRRAPPPPAAAPVAEAPPEIAVREAAPEPAQAAASAQMPVSPAKTPEILDLTEELTQAPAVEEIQPEEPSSPAEPPAVAGEKLTSEPDRPEPVVSQPEKVDPASEPVPPLGLVSAELEVPKEPPSTLSSLGLEIETEEDVVLRSSGASEFSVPDATQDLLEMAAKLYKSHPRSPGRRASDRPEAERRKAERATPPSPPRPEPPAPAEVAETVVPVRSYNARDTKGQSIAEFFQVLLAARPPDSKTAAPGEAGSPQDGRPSSKDTAVSFDDFFGGGAKGSPASASGGSEPSKEDLDQFQSWLQNLKR